MDPIERYNRQREIVEDLKREKERREGSLSTILEQLSDEFGVNTIAKAEKELKKQEALRERMEDEANALLDKIAEMINGKV